MSAFDAPLSPSGRLVNGFSSQSLTTERLSRCSADSVHLKSMIIQASRPSNPDNLRLFLAVNGRNFQFKTFFIHRTDQVLFQKQPPGSLDRIIRFEEPQIVLDQNVQSDGPVDMVAVNCSKCLTFQIALRSRITRVDKKRFLLNLSSNCRLHIL